MHFVVLILNSHKRKMAIKLRNEYGPVLHMPTSKENLKEKGPQNAAEPYPHKQYPANQGEDSGLYMNF